MKQEDKSSERDQAAKDFTMKTFFFWSSFPNLREKSAPKEDNIEFGAKYSPDCCRISNAYGLGCVSAHSKIFAPHETHYSGAWKVTVLF